MNDLPTCTCCRRELRDHETGRYLCSLCEDEASAQLAAIPVLFAQLDQHLAHGSSNGPAVSGSKTAPPPLRIHILNLQTERGPVLAPLEIWVRDWEEGGYAEVNEAGTVTDRLTHACRTLRFNLARAVCHHEFVHEFAEEVFKIHRLLDGITSGEKPARELQAQCPCGGTFPFTLNTRSGNCRACGIGYSHGEIMRLPLAERRAAA